MQRQTWFHLYEVPRAVKLGEKVGGWEPGAGGGGGVRGGLEGDRVSICPHDPRGRSGAGSNHTGPSRGMS